MTGSKRRPLLVIADDFGIGPETDRGILDVAGRGLLSGTVLLVNSPYAPAAVAAWRRLGRPVELGWHPNLTLDRPVARADEVPSLVSPEGCFWPLGRLVARLATGRVAPAQVALELRAQHRRFVELVGAPPAFVNTHQHVGLFPPVGRVLLDVLAGQSPRPLLRRVREPWSLLARVPGARKKRALLNLLGRRFARLQEARGFPGNDWLLGVTDPPWVRDPDFFPRWLCSAPDGRLELMCHPGHHDPTLLGRDAWPGDGLVQRRADELERLRQPDFLPAVAAAGCVLARPSDFLAGPRRAAG